MQVSYKTISSYEYDAISGQYKKVNKQVQDDSFDFNQALKDDQISLTTQTNSTNSNQAQTQTSSQYAKMSNMYAYRFKENS